MVEDDDDDDDDLDDDWTIAELKEQFRQRLKREGKTNVLVGDFGAMKREGFS